MSLKRHIEPTPLIQYVYTLYCPFNIGEFIQDFQCADKHFHMMYILKNKLWYMSGVRLQAYNTKVDINPNCNHECSEYVHQKQMSNVNISGQNDLISISCRICNIMTH